MRKLLALMAAALILGPVVGAYAAKVLRQNADGTATWVNTTDDSEPPAGEHHFTVVIPDLAAASTQYVVIPFKGRLKGAYGVAHGVIGTATAAVDFLVSSPASTGGFFNLFVPVTPAIAEAATGNYELILGLSYAGTGQTGIIEWPRNSNTSLDVAADSIIAIHTDGRSTQASGDADHDDLTITIVVH